jgi:hypothetical protein
VRGGFEILLEGLTGHDSNNNDRNWQLNHCDRLDYRKMPDVTDLAARLRPVVVAMPKKAYGRRGQHDNRKA